MLKYLVIIGICFLIACTIEGQLWDYEFNFPYGCKIETPYDAFLWVSSYIFYQKDNKDEWKTPEETFNDGDGDCEDVALLMMYLCYAYAGETPVMLEIDKGSGHMIVEVDGSLYDPKGTVTGHISELQYRILNSYTYGEAMYLAMVK